MWIYNEDAHEIYNANKLCSIYIADMNKVYGKFMNGDTTILYECPTYTMALQKVNQLANILTGENYEKE